MNRLKSLLSATKNISSESVELFFSGRAWKFVVCLLSFFSSQWQISGSALLHSQFSWSGGRDPSLLKKKKKKRVVFFSLSPFSFAESGGCKPSSWSLALLGFGHSGGDKQSVPVPSHFQCITSFLVSSRRRGAAFRSPLSAQHPMFPPPGCEAAWLCSRALCQKVLRAVRGWRAGSTLVHCLWEPRSRCSPRGWMWVAARLSLAICGFLLMLLITFK